MKERESDCCCGWGMSKVDGLTCGDNGEEKPATKYFVTFCDLLQEVSVDNLEG